MSSANDNDNVWVEIKYFPLIPLKITEVEWANKAFNCAANCRTPGNTIYIILFSLIKIGMLYPFISLMIMK